MKVTVAFNKTQVLLNVGCTDTIVCTLADDHGIGEHAFMTLRAPKGQGVRVAEELAKGQSLFVEVTDCR